jgi:hypothetical protein
MKKEKKRKRETPQKEWQAKCTRTQMRAHIVEIKKFPDKTKQTQLQRELSFIWKI